MVQSESDEEFFDVEEDDFHDAPEGMLIEQRHPSDDTVLD